ncbi:hypothetical protein PoB_005854800 [Plakobranchus ocellatus]|uniref:Uncharacterized protein n=1 Tax=Plakobranchus ocellatus TaxID=259542 RepID=A0AAV4CK74_9GAST|nr:hypothetical protein PoB_005854800 [Plakobranchus ocellatus]
MQAWSGSIVFPGLYPASIYRETRKLWKPVGKFLNSSNITIGEAVAHLEEQLATIQEVRGPRSPVPSSPGGVNSSEPEPSKLLASQGPQLGLMNIRETSSFLRRRPKCPQERSKVCQFDRRMLKLI